MIILRNEKECELTVAEMRQIYVQLKREYFKEDIQAKAEELEIQLSDEDIEKIADYADKGLSNNDSYWESYWMTIEYAIEAVTIAKIQAKFKELSCM